MDKTTIELEKIISPVYLVGGSVRDELLGKTPKDYDYTTPLTPDEIEAAIKAAGKRAYTVGKRFGTIGVMLDGEMVEITTFRTEKYSEGSRKPSVEYVTEITQDLGRRDFTINAMAKRGTKLIDPFEGQKDLEVKSIRCVGNPKARFKEDPLRILRAARFASQLEFSVEENTEKKAKEVSHRILTVSKERWVMELDKILMTRKPSIGLDFLMRNKLFSFMIPELAIQDGYDQNSPYHDMELWKHTLTVVDNVPAEINLRWASLLHDMGKPFVRTNKPDRSNYIKHDLLGAELVKRLASILRWSNDRKDKVSELVLNHMLETSPMRQADYIGKRVEKRCLGCGTVGCTMHNEERGI